MTASRISQYRVVSFVLASLAAAIGVLLITAPLENTFFFAGFVALGTMAVLTPVATLMALLVLAPLRTLMATEIPGQLPLDIGQLGFVGLLFCYAIYCVAERKAIIAYKWTPLYVLLGAFLIIAGLTGLGATSIGAWLDEWLKWVQMIVVIVLVINLSNRNEWQWLVFGLVIAASVNALVGIYQFLGGSGALHLVINDGYFRAFGTFGQPNPFGGFMGLVLPVALMSTVGYCARFWRHRDMTGHIEIKSALPTIFYFVASTILLAGLLASWSRGAWLSFATSCAVLAFALPRKTWQSISAVALLGVILFTFYSFDLLPQSILSRIKSATEAYFMFTDVRGVIITSENYPVVERLAHWQAALNMASGHPWLGVGQGHYELAYPDYRLLNWHLPLGHAHNYFLNVLAEAGIIGLLGYGKVWLGILWLTWRVRVHPDPVARLASIGLLGSWVYLSVHSVFDNLYVNNLFIHLGLMLGILAVLYNQTWNHHKAAI